MFTFTGNLSSYSIFDECHEYMIPNYNFLIKFEAERAETLIK